jgi:hypothetical protein
MTPTRINGATNTYVAPEGWDAEKDGECGKLPVRAEGRQFSSAWQPSPDELAMLNAGGCVVLTVFGGQPPVMLAVGPQQTQEQPSA